MDKEWDIDWFYGPNIEDIKEIPDGVLRSVTKLETIRFKGHWYWQKGASRVFRDGQYRDYLIYGELFALSTWWILLQRRLLFTKKRILLWTHGWYGREGSLKKLLKRIYFGMADHVLVYGDYSRKVAIEQGFPEHKLSVLYNSLDYDRHIRIREQLKRTSGYLEMFGNSDPTLLFIGRLTKVKRLDKIIRAMKILSERGENYNLIFIGDGTETENLKALTHESGLEKRVRFYGASYDEEENARLLFDADLCVSPGNIGLTAMHAMTFGLPVVTHDDFSWQMPEFEAVIPGRTGLFFKRDDERALADAISKWFAGPGKDRDAVREACYAEIAAHWTPTVQMDVLKKMFQQTTDGV